VLVIDTIAGICSEFISNSRGSSNYDTLERRNFLVKTSQLLKKYAHQHNLAVIVLNNVSSNINEDADIRKEKV
jgi:RecA/RadA recombinase